MITKYIHLSQSQYVPVSGAQGLWPLNMKLSKSQLSELHSALATAEIRAATKLPATIRSLVCSLLSPRLSSSALLLSPSTVCSPLLCLQAVKRKRLTKEQQEAAQQQAAAEAGVEAAAAAAPARIFEVEAAAVETQRLEKEKLAAAARPHGTCIVERTFEEITELVKMQRNGGAPSLCSALSAALNKSARDRGLPERPSESISGIYELFKEISAKVRAVSSNYPPLLLLLLPIPSPPSFLPTQPSPRTPQRGARLRFFCEKDLDDNVSAILVVAANVPARYSDQYVGAGEYRRNELLILNKPCRAPPLAWEDGAGGRLMAHQLTLK